MENYQGYKVMPYTEQIDCEQLFKRYSQKQNDWSAIYIQLDYKHAMSYIYTKYELFKDVCLLKFHFNDKIKFIKVNDQTISDFNICSKKKAQIVKKILKDKYQIEINEDQPLMETLGKYGIGLIMEDSEQLYEYIIPHQIIQFQNCCDIIKLARFTRHEEIIFRTIKLIINDEEQDLNNYKDNVHLFPFQKYLE